MSRRLITFIVITSVAGIVAWIIFLKLSADVARKQSNNILEQFKTVDQNLQQNKQRLDSLNKAFFDSLRKADK